MLIRLPKVLELTGLGKQTLYRMEARGDFPKRVMLGARSVAWDYDAIAVWVNSRPVIQPKGK
jgi:prophage regulatory protein